MSDTIQIKLKQILVELAEKDQLPLDMNDLNPDVFDPVIEPILEYFNLSIDHSLKFIKIINRII